MHSRVCPKMQRQINSINKANQLQPEKDRSIYLRTNATILTRVKFTSGFVGVSGIHFG